MSEEKQFITDRLRRYSKTCLADRLDPDFAEAVFEAAAMIDKREFIMWEQELLEERKRRESEKK